MPTRQSYLVTALLALLVVANLALVCISLRQDRTIERLDRDASGPVTSKATNESVEQTNGRAANGPEILEEKSVVSGKTKLVISHLCKGEAKQIPPAVGGSLDDTALVSYCVGENQLVIADGEETPTTVSATTSASVDDAPVLLSATMVSVREPDRGTVLIEYGVFPCTFSEDSCGVGLPQNTVTFAYDVTTATARPIAHYPVSGTALWNASGTKAIFPVVQRGGAGCDRGPIVGYSLDDDTQTVLTAETACAFDRGFAADVEGNPEPEWGPTFWTSDDAFAVVFLDTDGTWRKIEGRF